MILRILQQDYYIFKIIIRKFGIIQDEFHLEENLTMKKILALMLALLVIMSCFTAVSFAEDGTAGETVAEAAAETEEDATATAKSWKSYIWIAVYIVVLIAMFYFLIIRPQQKRKKEDEERKNSMCLGQEVVTIGGICGKIVNIKDDTITIQTSIDNTLMDFKDWAIREIKKQETV